MSEFTGCAVDTPGNYLNWNTAEWEVVGDRVEEVVVDFDEVCGQRDKEKARGERGKEKVVFPALMPWRSAETTCRKFGGHLGTILSLRELKSYKDHFSKNTKLLEGICTMDHSVWLGRIDSKLKYEDNQNKFLDKFLEKGWRERAGQAIQADLTMGRLYTRELDRTYCPACFFAKSNYLGMRGGGSGCMREDHGNTK